MQPAISHSCRTRLALALLALALLPRPVSAQLGIFDALARRFSDVSFFGTYGALYPRPDNLSSDGLVSYGIEVLLEIGAISRPTGPPPARRDSVTRVWTEMRVTRGDDGSVDTVYTYQIRPVAVVQPMQKVWTFELGLGYGQMSGFDLNHADLDLRGSVRDLPSVAVYATWERTGVYFGARSGFMKLQGLQLYDAEGRSFSGEAESFLAGVVLGQGLEISKLLFFLEGAYTTRSFPSIRWSGGPLPAGAPRDLALHGWSLGIGMQFPVGGN